MGSKDWEVTGPGRGFGAEGLLLKMSSNDRRQGFFIKGVCTPSSVSVRTLDVEESLLGRGVRGRIDEPDWRRDESENPSYKIPAFDFRLSDSSSTGSSSYLSSSIRPMPSSSSPISIPSSCPPPPFSRPLVIKYTPRKVSKHPPMNFTNLSAVADSKSRYKMALPMITERVNRTNWVGITWVESKR